MNIVSLAEGKALSIKAMQRADKGGERVCRAITFALCNSLGCCFDCSSSV
jgi:hypothetical protein